jgi:pimeloyl-ACP methyl ester carboxylesterase
VPDEGKPVVILSHCLGGNASTFAKVQKELAARGFRSIAIDRPGMGFSDRDTEEPTEARQVGNMEDLLRRLGLDKRPIILAGHSLGGTIDQLYAKRHADHVVGQVLIDAPPDRGMSVPKYVGQIYGPTRTVGEYLPSSLRFTPVGDIRSPLVNEREREPELKASKRHWHETYCRESQQWLSYNP